MVVPQAPREPAAVGATPTMFVVSHGPRSAISSFPIRSATSTGWYGTSIPQEPPDRPVRRTTGAYWRASATSAAGAAAAREGVHEAAAQPSATSINPRTQ